MGPDSFGVGLAFWHLRPPRTLLFVALGVFVWTRALSIVTAVDPRLGAPVFTQLLKDTLTVVIVVTLGTWAAHGLPSVVKLAVVATAGVTGLALMQQFVIGTGNDLRGFSIVRQSIDIGAATLRFQGPTEDANFWARVLVAVFPFAIAAIVTARSRFGRVVMIGAAVSLLGGVYLTQSRGGLLAIGLSLFIIVALAGGRARRLLLAAPVLVAILLLNPATGPRLASLVDITKSDEDVTDLSIAYREAAQKGGLQMFRDHPVTGVGVGNFDSQLLPYIRDGIAPLPPSAKFSEIAPHNSYLQVAAESGLIGLAGYLFLFGTALACAIGALAHISRAPTDHPLTRDLLWFTRACLAGLLGWAFVSIFLHEAQRRTLYALFALAAAAAAVAREHLPATPRPSIPWALVRADLGRVLVAFAASTMALLALPSESSAWQRSVRTLIVVNEPEPKRFPYIQNFMTHGYPWRSTLAIIEDNRSQQWADLPADVRLTTTPRRFLSSIDFTVSGDDRSAVDQAVAVVQSHVVGDIASLGVPFAARPLAASPATRSRSIDARLAAAAIALPLLLVGASWRRISRRRRRFADSYATYRESLGRSR